jgi:hypothetical protein
MAAEWRIAAFEEKDNFFGDVGGMVGDALEALGDGHKVEGTGDGIWILEQEADEFAIELFVQRVHLFVARNETAKGYHREDFEDVFGRYAAEIPERLKEWLPGGRLPRPADGSAQSGNEVQ